jgi:cytochrome c oxidase subunit I+III
VWGLRFAHAANATLLASLIFGYFFLWTVAPAWPPVDFLATPAWLPLGIAGGLSAGAVAVRRALILTGAGGARAAGGWLSLAGAAGVLAAAGFFAVPAVGVGSPTAHAYPATVAALAGYGGLHAALAGVWCGYVLLRRRRGFVSAARSLDLQVLDLWWRYTAAAGALILVCLYAAPWALSP